MPSGTAERRPDDGGDSDVGDKIAAPKSVLFACSWNATRSPMAAALLDRLARGRVTVRSAGVLGGRPVDPMAVRAMAEAGYDIAQHRPNSLTDIEAAGGDVGAFDLIIALSPAASREAEAIGRLADVLVEHWSVADPTQAEGPDETRLAAYRAVREALESETRRRFRALAETSAGGSADSAANGRSPGGER